jgi:stress response protein SCP2
MQNDGMTNVTIRNVPAPVHSTLMARAADRGQSFQQYMLGEITRLADRSSTDEVLARFSNRSGGTAGFEAAVSLLDSARSAR